MTHTPSLALTLLGALPLLSAGCFEAFESPVDPVYEGDEPQECSDGVDNDHDGLFDGGDPDCFGAPACSEVDPADDDDVADDDDTLPADDDDTFSDDDDTLPADDDDTLPDDDDEVSELPVVFDPVGLPDDAAFTEFGEPWPSQALTWGLVGGTAQLADASVRGGIELAAGLWEAACPGLELQEAGAAQTPDIALSFEVGDHGDGYEFDGLGDPVQGYNVLAHGFPPNAGGAVHFDDEDAWSVTLPLGAGTHDVVTVAAHELGHALGIGHSAVAGALMAPSPTPVHRWLAGDDEAAIAALYDCGGCSAGTGCPPIDTFEARAWEGPSLQDNPWEAGLPCTASSDFLSSPVGPGDTLTIVEGAKVLLSWSAPGATALVFDPPLDAPADLEADGDTLSFTPWLGLTSIALEVSNGTGTSTSTIDLQVSPHPAMPASCAEIPLSPQFLAGQNAWQVWASGGEAYECPTLQALGDGPSCDTCNTGTSAYVNGPDAWSGAGGSIVLQAPTDLSMRYDFWEHQHTVPAGAAIWVDYTAEVQGGARARAVVDFRPPNGPVSAAPEGSEGPFVYPDGQPHSILWDHGAGLETRPSFEARSVEVDGLSRVVLILSADAWEAGATASFDDVSLWCCGAGCGTCQDWDGDGFGTWCAGGTDCDDSDADAFPGSSVGDDCGVSAPPPPPPSCVDADSDGYGVGCAAGPDCDDTRASVHPGAAEQADYRDDDCDGQVDEGFRVPVYRHHWSASGDSDHLLWWSTVAPGPGWIADGTGFSVYTWDLGHGADTVQVGAHQLGLLRQCENWPAHEHVYCMVDAAECVALAADPGWTCWDFGYVNSTLSVVNTPSAVGIHRSEHGAWTDIMYGTEAGEGASLGYVDQGVSWWAWSGN